MNGAGLHVTSIGAALSHAWSCPGPYAASLTALVRGTTHQGCRGAPLPRAHAHTLAVRYDPPDTSAQAVTRVLDSVQACGRVTRRSIEVQLHGCTWRVDVQP